MRDSLCWMTPPLFALQNMHDLAMSATVQREVLCDLQHLEVARC